MEQHEKDYITKIAPDLNPLINLNTTVLARLRANDILSDEDLAELQAISNVFEKKYRFLDIVKTKPNGYKLMTESLREVKQNGAVELLDKITTKVFTKQDDETNATSAAAQNVTSDLKPTVLITGSGKRIYNLNFGDDDVISTVLPRVRADLVSKMNSEEANTTIISQLAALNYFDHQEIQMLITGEHRSQQKRMQDLFAQMANLDDEEVLACFEKLCNLDDLPRASERFRKIFKKHFPECI